MHRQQLKVNARQWAVSPYWTRITTGSDVKASRYIKQVDIKPGVRIVPVCRVSFRHQKDALSDQETAIRKAVKAAGGTIVRPPRPFHHVGHTKGAEYYEFVRAVAAYCKQHKCIPVAETADRWCRHWLYDVAGSGEDAVSDAESKTRRPGENQFINLMEAADGVQLHTLHNPDLSAGEVRSVQTKRAGKAGRPMRRKNRRAKLLPVVLEMHERGANNSEIERETGVSRRTVRRWITNQGAKV